MDLRKIKHLSNMFEAYLEGKTVQIQYIDRWADIKDIGDFKNIFNEFRIKPQRELVPFTFEDNKLFRDKWVKRKGCFPLSRITCFGPKGLCYSEASEWESYEDCLEKYEFEDGSPYGKYINE